MTRIDALLEAARQKLAPYRLLIESGDAPAVATVTVIVQLDAKGQPSDVIVRTESRRCRRGSTAA